MTFTTAAAAYADYKAGNADAALAETARIVELNPFDADAHMTRALIFLRRGEVAGTIQSLKACLASRPAEWILERMRQDLMRSRPPLSRDMAFKLGSFFRLTLPALGPPVPTPLRRASHEFVNIVGSSYVRSFGGSSVLFPLFIGMGPTMLLLSDAEAAVTRRKFAENLKRVDTSRNTMLIAGSDPYYYVTSLAKAGVQRAEATDEDLAIMDAVAERHRPILTDAKALMSGETILLGLTPTFNACMNQLCRRLNVGLKALCEETGVAFVDWWDELADPVTGNLRDELAAKAYPGDIHFSLATTRLFIELLQRDGFLGREVSTQADFEWSHVFEVTVEASEKTRIWSEPSVTPRNAFQSDKVASAHLGGQIADILTCLSSQLTNQSYLMVNVRDGFLPVAVPGQMQSGCLAFTDTAQNLEVGRQVLDFYGRLDVRLELPDQFPLIDGQAFSCAVLLIHPDTQEVDEARCREVIARLPKATEVYIGTPRPDRIGELALGERTPMTIAISNRHIPEKWRDYSLVIAR